MRFLIFSHRPSITHVSRRENLREYAAEFLGTAILVIFGTGVNCQVTLSTNAGVASSPKGVSIVYLNGFVLRVADASLCLGLSLS